MYICVLTRVRDCSPTRGLGVVTTHGYDPRSRDLQRAARLHRGQTCPLSSALIADRNVGPTGKMNMNASPVTARARASLVASLISGWEMCDRSSARGKRPVHP